MQRHCFATAAALAAALALAACGKHPAAPTNYQDRKSVV